MCSLSPSLLPDHSLTTFSPRQKWAVDIESLGDPAWAEFQMRVPQLHTLLWQPVWAVKGIALKTAWTLLRKHGSAENVIRAVQIEGKKPVPKGYMQAFKLAEKVFLHQRVYDPLKHTLVNLSPIPDGEEWDDEKEAHVGR